jgi:quercetin dioxygenase-like cupin family protein
MRGRNAGDPLAWHQEKNMRRVLWFAAALAAAVWVLPAAAQDAVKTDPKHYKVEFENAQVRVLRVTYGPGEKSVMHSHPANVAVFLNDAHGKFTLPDGKTLDSAWKAGAVMWDPGSKHLPENVGDKPFELILVELKTKHKAAK